VTRSSTEIGRGQRPAHYPRALRDDLHDLLAGRQALGHVRAERSRSQSRCSSLRPGRAALEGMVSGGSVLVILAWVAASMIFKLLVTEVLNFKTATGSLGR
jgi:hypothetical protein